MSLLEQMVRQLRLRVDAMVTRAVVELVKDSLKTQRLQLTVLADEVVDDVEHMQPYGLSFVPPAGAEAIALAMSGSRSHTVAICVQHPDERPKSKQPREGGLYTKGQWRLFIDADGKVCVGADASDQHLVLGDLLVEILGQLTVPTAMGPSGTPINAVRFNELLSKHLVAR